MVEMQAWAEPFAPVNHTISVGCPMGPEYGEVEICWGNMAWAGYYSPWNNTYQDTGCCGHVTFTNGIRGIDGSDPYNTAEYGSLDFIGVCDGGGYYYGGGRVEGRKTNLFQGYWNSSWSVGYSNQGILYGAISGPGYNSAQLTLSPAREYISMYGELTLPTWVKWTCHDIDHTELPMSVGPHGSSWGPWYVSGPSGMPN